MSIPRSKSFLSHRLNHLTLEILHPRIGSAVRSNGSNHPGCTHINPCAEFLFGRRVNDEFQSFAWPRNPLACLLHQLQMKLDGLRDSAADAAHGSTRRDATGQIGDVSTVSRFGAADHHEKAHVYFSGPDKPAFMRVIKCRHSPARPP